MADDAGHCRAKEGSEQRSLEHEEPLEVESLWQLIEGTPAQEPADPLIGLTVAGVTLTRLIAEGGMGRVYEGRQIAPSRLVAVKLLRPGVLARGSIERFVREAEILGRLRHPCITQIYSAGTVEVAGAGLPYFVMELIPEARPITEYARRHDLRLADRIGLFQQVCEAVGHAHERDVIHRDLKPSNILVSRDGQPGVIDFGVARSGWLAGTDGAATATGQLLGTLQYMSPEQIDGRPVGARSDVYSLGMILHELVFGCLPYETAGRPLVDAARMIRETRPAAGDLLAHSSPGISLIIDRCLQKNPGRRYCDAGELAADVRRCLSWEASLATTVAARARLVTRRFLPGSKRVSSLWLLLVTAAVGGPLLLLPAGAVRPPAISVIEPPTLAAAILPFRFSISSVFDPEADQFLVEAAEVQKWDDPREEPRLTYWGPSRDGVEGRLVYRFLLPGRSARIHVRADSQCWDFRKHPGGFGRGVSAIEASRDGEHWVTLRDNISQLNWGASWELDEPLPATLLGTDSLWLRIRFLTEAAEPERGYTVAQFARSVTGRSDPVFMVEADCEPTP